MKMTSTLPYRRGTRALILAALVPLFIAGCTSIYYNAMETLGVEKRDMNRLIRDMEASIAEANKFIATVVGD